MKTDAIVIGAGISGTVAGAYLAKGGLKTAIFEATDQVGGPFWGSYTKPGGYKNEFTSHLPAWWMTSNGGDGWWPKAARDVGAELRWVIMPNNAILGPWMKEPLLVPYCSNGQAYASFIQSMSPMPVPEATKEGLARVFEALEAIPEAELYSEKYETMPLGQFVAPITSDPGALFSLSRTAGFTGAQAETALEDVSVTLFAAASIGVFFRRFCLCAMVGDTSNAIPKAFADAAVRHGAQVHLSHTVKEILFQGSRARGVVVATPSGDQTFEADVVVVASRWDAYRQLLGAHLPRELEPTLARFEEKQRMTLDIHWGLKRAVIPQPNWANVMVLTAEATYDFMYAVPSFYNEAFAPKGKQLIHIEMFRSFADYGQKSQAQWVDYIRDYCERLYPGLKDAIEWQEIITRSPILSHQYLPVRKVPNRCPGIANLYFAGDATQGMGLVTERAASSAMAVASAILKKA